MHDGRREKARRTDAAQMQQGLGEGRGAQAGSVFRSRRTQGNIRRRARAERTDKRYRWHKRGRRRQGSLRGQQAPAQQNVRVRQDRRGQRRQAEERGMAGGTYQGLPRGGDGFCCRGWGRAAVHAGHRGAHTAGHDRRQGCKRRSDNTDSMAALPLRNARQRRAHREKAR